MVKIKSLLEAEPTLEQVAQEAFRAFGRMAQYGMHNEPEKERDGRMHFGVRDIGDWVVPDDAEDDGDYDWKVPTKQTRDSIKKQLDELNKKYPKFKISAEGSEKNWIEFYVEVK